MVGSNLDQETLMGRLEDIADRNKQARKGGPWGGIVGLASKLGNREKPDARPDIPGMRRKNTTSPLIVIPVMLVIALVVGYLTCRRMDYNTDYEKRMMGEGR